MREYAHLNDEFYRLIERDRIGSAVMLVQSFLEAKLHNTGPRGAKILQIAGVVGMLALGTFDAGWAQHAPSNGNGSSARSTQGVDDPVGQCLRKAELISPANRSAFIRRCWALRSPDITTPLPVDPQRR